LVAGRRGKKGDLHNDRIVIDDRRWVEWKLSKIDEKITKINSQKIRKNDPNP